MSRTIRWWYGKQKYIDFGRKFNPFRFKHESKFVRTKLHRAYRRNNKIRIQKGIEIEIEKKTNGWITH